MNWKEVIAKQKKANPPQWADYLTFAWPPLSWDGEPLHRVAVYDLEYQPSTFDFVTWAVMVRTLGAQHVRFAYEGKIQDWKYPASIAWRRFANIIIPVCELAGFKWSIGPRCRGFTVGHHYGHVNQLAEHCEINKIPLTAGPENHVTVTIRDSIRFKSRDSNRKEWDRVIRELEKSEKVIVIEDGETSGLLMTVEERMRLYSSAKMNLGVSNGPMALCHFSDAPYLTFKMIPDGEDGEELRSHTIRGGFPPGSQFSFRNHDQELVWEMDTYDNIMAAYDAELRAAA